MARKNWRNVALLTAALAMASFAASCGRGGGDDGTGVTYRTYTTVMPSNWNELTYADENDTQIMYNLSSSFFEYDYEFDESLGGKFNADGTINADAIVSGGYDVKYSAAIGLEDVTATVDSKWGYTDEQKEAGGYAWKFTLRDDLAWDDGTPITAEDFVYTMQEQLNPLFFNMRASTYYVNMSVKGAREYLYSASEMVYVTISSEGYTSVSDALENYDGDLYIDVYNFYNAEGYVDAEGNECPQYVSIDSTTVYDTPEAWESGTAEDAFSGQMLITEYLSYLTTSDVYAYVENEDYGVTYDNVGFYSPSTYELVICLDSPVYALKEDGSLSYLAAYTFQSFPLVKRDLYESCKQAPVAGSELWTSNYGSSLETTASWGPYKLTQFQRGHSYTLSRNDEWFGYDLDDYAGQYQVTSIHCQQMAEVETQWMSFLSGATDEVGLDVGHRDDYRSSRYTYFAPGEGTYGINLYSNLTVLNNNDRNNSILAITEFRKALSLALNRDAYNTTVYTSHQTCYGLLGPSYYYDIENGGVYRDTQYAKEALLRVYGFTENEDGTWTDGITSYADYEAAYAVMNGYNLTQAKELVEEAYTTLTTDDRYVYDPNSQITLVIGGSSNTETFQLICGFIEDTIENLIEGTSLEGKITVTSDTSFGTSWANDFRSGAYDIAPGTGFRGGAFDPAGMLQGYVDPEAGLMYSTWWDTAADKMTYTMPEGDYAESGQTYEMSVLNWYCCLNGIAERRDQEYTFNWGSGSVDENIRLELLAQLEQYILEKYYTIATTSEYSAMLYGAKFSNLTGEYNVFMGFGGYRYMIANYNDGEWNSFVSSQGGNLETLYRQTY